MRGQKYIYMQGTYFVKYVFHIVVECLGSAMENKLK